MGKKKTPAEKPEEAATNKKEEEEAKKEKAEKEGANKKAEEEEDPPLVKELKVIDDKYLEIEREFEKERNELEKKYDKRRAPLLQERLKLLTADSSSEGVTAKGTPALEGFWLQAMRNLPALEDQIEDWDEPVLEYLRDITRTNLDPDDSDKGFKLTFHFVENPYFTNEVLWKEYHTEESSPYVGDINATNIKVSEIEWKPGKNVTVETIRKKVKGGGAKKQKQKNKETTEPRDSFFRNFFRNLHSDMDIPDDVNIEGDEDEDEEDLMEVLIECDYDMGMAIRDQLIPFAVRWYTGEARPEDDDDYEDDEEDDDYEDDDDEDEEDEDDDPPPKKKAQPKKKGSGSGGEDKKKGGGAPEQKPEECKQQ